MVRLKFFLPPNEGELVFFNRKSIVKRIRKKIEQNVFLLLIGIMIVVTLGPEFVIFDSLDKTGKIVFLIVGSLLTTSVVGIVVVLIVNIGLKLFPSFRSTEVLEKIYFFNGFLSSTSSEKENYKFQYSEFTHFQFDGGRNVSIYCYDDKFLSDLDRLTMSELQLKYYKEKTLDEFYEILRTKNKLHRIELKIVKKYSTVGEQLIGFLNNKISESKTIESKN